MTAHPETKAHAGAWGVPMAKGSSSLPADHQRQRLTHTERGQSLLGMCAPILAVDYAQDWSASCRAGLHQPVKLAPVSAGVLFTKIPDRLVSSPSRRRAFRGSFLLPDNRGARHFICATIGLQSRRPHSNSHLLKLIRQDRSEQFHFQSCLSQKRLAAGFKNASERGQKIGNSGQVGAA